VGEVEVLECSRDLKQRRLRRESGTTRRSSLQEFCGLRRDWFPNQPARARVGAPEPCGVKIARLHGRAAGAVPGSKALLRKRRWNGALGERFQIE
jgi:hypothetical protein